jgi:hypothetical protein
MPHVVLERDGLRIEADLSLNDIKDLMGVKSTSNGHSAQVPASNSSAAQHWVPSSATGYAQFMEDISDRGRKFIELLKANPTGIEANSFAAMLGFTSPSQIGGLSGGGLAKVAKNTKVDLRKIYRTEITTPNGNRTVTFYPGELLLNEKPAV